MQVTEGVIFAPIGDGFQVFCISTVSDAYTGDLTLFSHVHGLLFFHNGIIGKLIPGDPAALFHKSDDPLCVGIGLRDLIQGVFDEILVFHITTPL